MLLPFIAMLAAPIEQTPVPPAPVAASDPSATDQLLARSTSIGRLLFAFDRAAWVSTDALTAVLAKDGLTGAGGYVVERIDADTLRVTYYRGGWADAQAFFIADVRDGKVANQTVLAPPVALTAAQAVLAHARDVAAEEARQRAYKPCTRPPFNTVVLPSRNDGPVAVYLLSAQQDLGSYPLGGNYRVVVAPDGKVLASRPYSVSCINMAPPKLSAGARPVGFLVNHLLDPVPTEIHVFASLTMKMPLFVATPDRRVWIVQRGTISLPAAK